MHATILLGVLLSAAWPSDMTPLTTLGPGKYQDFVGGLYAEGRNEPWGPHAEALKHISATIRPLDRDGQPDPQGKIVVAGIGASVCRQVFGSLEQVGLSTTSMNPAVTFVNCALGGQDVNKLEDVDGRYWRQAKETLANRNLTPLQVQVIWYQSDDLRDTRDDFPGRPERLKEHFAESLRLTKPHFPNARVCYFSGRHTTAVRSGDDENVKHAEPRPYHNGWAVKWLIEDQAAGREDLCCEGPEAVAPLAAWATYFWTNGAQPRDDGYRWTADDVVAEGVHLSPAGQERVAKELLTFWSRDAAAKTWFLTSPGGAAASEETPAWIVNGKNKLPKLTRLVGDVDQLRVVVHNMDGKQVAELRDVLRRRTDLNAMLGRGEYRLEFFDGNDQRIKLTQEVGEILQLK